MVIKMPIMSTDIFKKFILSLLFVVSVLNQILAKHRPRDANILCVFVKKNSIKTVC